MDINDYWGDYINLNYKNQQKKILLERQKMKGVFHYGMGISPSNCALLFAKERNQRRVPQYLFFALSRL